MNSQIKNPIYDVWLGGNEINALIPAFIVTFGNVGGPGDFGYHFWTEDLNRAQECICWIRDEYKKLTGLSLDGARIEKNDICPNCGHHINEIEGE